MARIRCALRRVALVLLACAATACGLQGEPSAPLSAWEMVMPGRGSGGYRVSPDGAKIAWTGTRWWRATLFVRDNRDGSMRYFRARGAARWSPDSRFLVFESDTSGTESTHVYAIDTDTGAERDLTPYGGVKASIHRMPPGMPGQVLITHNRRKAALFDLYRVDMASGRETLVAANPGNSPGPVTRDDGALVAWAASRASLLANPEKQVAQPERAAAARARDDTTVRVIGPGPDPHVAWALSNRGRDKSALVALHLGRTWEAVEHADATGDVGGAIISAVTRRPLIAYSETGRPRFTILDRALAADLADLLSRQGHRDFGLEIVSTDAAERTLVVNTYDSVQTSTWLVRRGMPADLLAETIPAAVSSRLRPAEPVRFTSRDGLPLEGYVLRPQGEPGRRHPMVLLVHGGPWSHVAWGDPARSEDMQRAQFLASRGYAVLMIDFRGSTGHGRAFLKAAMGEFARRMQDDLIDALDWAVKSGVADPARVAILGHSYGGYAALTAMYATPDRFACGVSIAGPTDLPSLVESFPAHWQVDLSMWHEFVGDPRVPADRAEMSRRSPLAHAAGIKRPVLLLHGERDVRVRVDQARRMAAALHAAGRPVRLVTIAGMGHSPSWWAHRYRTLRETEEFLASCIGGRAAGFDFHDPLVRLWTLLPD